MVVLAFAVHLMVSIQRGSELDVFSVQNRFFHAIQIFWLENVYQQSIPPCTHVAMRGDGLVPLVAFNCLLADLTWEIKTISNDMQYMMPLTGYPQ